MLPSTGYFKTINCPFYENGSCERPYCHFKHSRREDVASTTGVAGMVEAQGVGQTQAKKTTTSIATSNSQMLQQLVTEAVKKVLADQEVTDTDKFSKTIVSQVVEGLKPTLAPDSSTSSETVTSNIIGKHINIPTPITKPVPCVYNPTPIAELKKRHIPVVSYMPTRESRVAVKRKSSPDRIKPWLNVIKDSSSSQSSELTYKPTAIANNNDQDCAQSYIPTFKSDSSSSNSYEDSNSNDYTSKVKEAYYPKSKKRREEYVPRKVKAPLKNVEHLDDNVLDQFESEFDIIDEILTSARTATSIPPSEESNDYCLSVEPKFSDDEPIEETTNVVMNETDDFYTAKTTKTDCTNTKKERDICQTRTVSEKIYGENVDNKKYNNYYKEKNIERIDNTVLSNENSKDHQQYQANENANKTKEKGSDKQQNVEKKKKDHKSSSRNCHKDKKDHGGSEKSSRDKHLHKSRSDERKEFSSHKSKNDDKDRQSKKDTSNKTKEHSERKSEHSTASESKKSKHKSSKHESHRSKSHTSTSRSEKHSSNKNHRKHRSRSRHRSPSCARKSSKHKENSSERNTSDRERSNSPFDVRSSLDEDISFLNVSDSDHDVQEECLKIFQEYQVSDHPKVISVKESFKPDINEAEDTGRKRVAHPSAATAVSRQVGPSQSMKKLPNPQQRMYEKWRMMREAVAEKALANNKMQLKTEDSVESTSVVNNNELQLNGHGRIRIAHVPYAMSLAMKKKHVAKATGKALSDKVTDSRTIAQTTKSGVRVAHIPQVIPQLVHPEPIQTSTQKFPLNVRQGYINIMHDISVQIYPNSKDAAMRAVREEFACYEKCKALSVYKNSCLLATYKLRKEVQMEKEQDTSSEIAGASASGMMSHEAVLLGRSKGSWSVLKSKRTVMDFKGSIFYNMLKKWMLTEQQLMDNGFPRPHPDGTKGRATMYATNTRNQSTLSNVPNERICNRCGQSYMVDRYGFAVQQQNCIYHWGRKFTIRGESKYSCCQQYGSATGCCDAKNHVWDYTDIEHLKGYVKTLPKDGPVEEQGVYAIDCEMCYTTCGLELTRVTVINEDCNVVYETLVKPSSTIIDYNTRFSGITEEDMENVETSIRDVQATLLSMFSDKTVLIGHSLESDFKALRLLHDTVVDTSVVFPHRNGYPQKRALKNLCSEYLSKIIQNDIGGHDSKEDAISCMELILWKVKEEAKLQ